MITTSYGRAARIAVNGIEVPTGILYGSGYGRDREVSAEADRAADILEAEFALDFEKRGNSGGRDAAACHDEPDDIGGSFNLGAYRRDDGEIRYTANLWAPICRAPDMFEDGLITHLPRHYSIWQTENAEWSGDSLVAGIEWLRRYAPKYCPCLGAARGTFADAVQYIAVPQQFASVEPEYLACLVIDHFYDLFERTAGDKKLNHRTGGEWLRAIHRRVENEAKRQLAAV